MRHPLPRRLSMALLSLLIGAATTASSLRAAEPELPSFAEVSQAVQVAAATRKIEDPQEILSRSDVKTLLDSVRGLGWEVQEAKQIEEMFLEDTHFMVRQLRTKPGRLFMKKVSQLPGGYERLERLTELSSGKRLVADLIRAKGGSQLIEYLTTSRGGRYLTRELTRTTRGKNFAKQTGHLYTLKDFQKALQEAYLRQQRQP